MTQNNFCNRTRREFLWETGAGFTGLALAGMLDDDFLAKQSVAADGKTKFVNPLAPKDPHFKPKAKSVILLWLWGGPSHVDTFDPKPDAGRDYCGSLNKPIETNVKGTRICQLLPQLAKQADKYSIIRSMTHGVNAHETASYTVQSGRKSGGRIVYPSIGAVVALKKGYDAGYAGMIPPYIVLTEPQGRFSEAGFLGPKYKPFATGGNPAQTPFAVEGIVAQGISEYHIAYALIVIFSGYIQGLMGLHTQHVCMFADPVQLFRIEAPGIDYGRVHFHILLPGQVNRAKSGIETTTESQ